MYYSFSFYATRLTSVARFGIATNSPRCFGNGKKENNAPLVTEFGAKKALSQKRPIRHELENMNL